MFLRLCNAALDGLEILDQQLIVDDLLVADGIHRAVDMGYIIVVEATQHVDNGICLADIGQKLVAEAFAFASAFDQSGDVDDLHRGRNDASRIAHLDKACQAVVGDGDDSHIRLYGAEGEVGRLRLSV